MAGTIINGDRSPRAVGQSPSYTYELTLIADASGAVNAEPYSIHPGYLMAVDTIPDGDDPPTDGYTLAVLTDAGVDLLAGGGINRSATDAQRLIGKPSMVSGQVYPTLSGAGSGGKVRVLLWLQGC